MDSVAREVHFRRTSGEVGTEEHKLGEDTEEQEYSAEPVEELPCTADRTAQQECTVEQGSSVGRAEAQEGTAEREGTDPAAEQTEQQVGTAGQECTAEQVGGTAGQAGEQEHIENQTEELVDTAAQDAIRPEEQVGIGEQVEEQVGIEGQVEEQVDTEEQAEQVGIGEQAEQVGDWVWELAEEQVEEQVEVQTAVQTAVQAAVQAAALVEVQTAVQTAEQVRMLDIEDVQEQHRHYYQVMAPESLLLLPDHRYSSKFHSEQVLDWEAPQLEVDSAEQEHRADHYYPDKGEAALEAAQQQPEAVIQIGQKAFQPVQQEAD